MEQSLIPGKGPKATKTGICRGDPQVARIVAVDQVKPLGELRLAPSVPDMCWI